jgi:hypothetical protein
MIRRPSIINAHVRIVQPKPIMGISRFTIIGITTPPILDPLAAMPIAKARFFRNHVVIQLKEGYRTMAAPMGLQMD